MQIEEAKQELNNLIVTLEIKHLGGAEAIDTLITYVETMQKEFDRLEGIEDNTAMLKHELKKKDAVIDEMAKFLAQTDIDEAICKDIEYCTADDEYTNCYKCIKEYFYKKAQN